MKTCQKTMGCSSYISLPILLYLVTHLGLALGDLEEPATGVGFDVVAKRSLMAKQSMLLGKWNQLRDKSLKNYLKYFRRSQGGYGKRSDGLSKTERTVPSKVVFMGKRPRPLRMGKRTPYYLINDNNISQNGLMKKEEISEENGKRTVGGPLGWEIWK